MTKLSPEQFELVERLFHEAASLPPDERTSYLQRACGGDAQVRGEVEVLLGAPSDIASALSDVGSVPAVRDPRDPMIGARLGACEMVGVIGRGGMGVVYRARDTRLGRWVAVKAIPPQLPPERAARLMREARLLASLSHPNVATVYGLEEDGTSRYLIMELIEGPTLAHRLAQGPLPLGEAIHVCRQIAAGIAAAHDAGVIHRDLKPGNVMITASGTVKVLDFGLARALRPSEPADVADAYPPPNREAHHDPTQILTSHGAVAGTPGYMSPEQARGEPVDRRTDVFSFGCILYKCVTGRSACPERGGARAESASIDWGVLPANTPPALRRLLRRCLAEDPERRLHDMADARLELDEAEAQAAGTFTDDAPPPTRRKRVIAHALLATAALAMGLGALALLFPRHSAVPPTPLRRFAIPFPANHPQLDLSHVRLALSRDGRRMAVSASDGSDQHLWVRDFDAADWRQLDGTAEAWLPSFSPDGQWIVYFDGGAMRKCHVSDGSAVKVADAGGFWGPYNWGSDGMINYVPYWGRGVARVSHRGGTPQRVTQPNHADGDFAHYSPHLLPNGQALLYGVWDGNLSWRIDALNLKTQKRHTVVRDGTTPTVAAAPGGHYLFYERGGSVYAAPFDLATALTSGNELLVATGVMKDRVLFSATFDVADDGTFAYIPGPTFAEESRLSWLDPTRAPATRPTALGEERMSFVDPSFSADGKRLAVVVKGDLYVPYFYDFDRGIFERVVLEKDCASAAISPDGGRLVYSGNKDGPYSLWLKDLVSGAEEKLMPGGTDYQSTPDWSPDGKFVAFTMPPDLSAPHDVWVVDVAKREARRFCAGPGADRAPRFSPDGKWLAYVSDESGNREVYLRSFPEGDHTRQISSGGGDWPEWAPDGASLYFRTRGGLFSVPVKPDGSVTSRPTLVYAGRFGQSDHDLSDYAVAPDGRLLLVELSERGPTVSQINVVLNWHQLVTRTAAAR